VNTLLLNEGVDNTANEIDIKPIWCLLLEAAGKF